MRNSSLGLGRGQAEIHYAKAYAPILPSAADSFRFANSAAAGPQLKSRAPKSSRVHTWISMGVVRPTARSRGLAEVHNRDSCRAGLGGLPDAVVRRPTLAIRRGRHRRCFTRPLSKRHRYYQVPHPQRCGQTRVRLQHAPLAEAWQDMSVRDISTAGALWSCVSTLSSFGAGG